VADVVPLPHRAAGRGDLAAAAAGSLTTPTLPPPPDASTALPLQPWRMASTRPVQCPS
jgi:hypothetical protein